MDITLVTLVSYSDTNDLSVRRDTVQKEVLHALIGITKARKIDSTFLSQ